MGYFPLFENLGQIRSLRASFLDPSERLSTNFPKIKVPQLPAYFTDGRLVMLQYL